MLEAVAGLPGYEAGTWITKAKTSGQTDESFRTCHEWGSEADAKASLGQVGGHLRRELGLAS